MIFLDDGCMVDPSVVRAISSREIPDEGWWITITYQLDTDELDTMSAEGLSRLQAEHIWEQLG